MPLATQERLLRIYCTWYLSLRIRTTTTYILHVVPITTHTKDRRESIGNKQRKEKKMKKRKDKKAKNDKGNERKEEKRKEIKDKTIRGSKERKTEKMSYQQTLGTD